MPGPLRAVLGPLAPHWAAMVILGKAVERLLPDQYRTIRLWRQLLPIYVAYMHTKASIALQSGLTEEQQEALWAERHEWGGDQASAGSLEAGRRRSGSFSHLPFSPSSGFFAVAGLRHDPRPVGLLRQERPDSGLEERLHARGLGPTALPPLRPGNKSTGYSLTPPARRRRSERLTELQMPPRPWAEVELSIDEQIQRCPLAKLPLGIIGVPSVQDSPKVGTLAALIRRSLPPPPPFAHRAAPSPLQDCQQCPPRSRRDGRLHETDVFQWVDHEAVAAASIAQASSQARFGTPRHPGGLPCSCRMLVHSPSSQVHMARLSSAASRCLSGASPSSWVLDHSDVVLKVQHRDMEGLMAADMRNIGRVASFLRGVLPFDIMPMISEIR